MGIIFTLIKYNFKVFISQKVDFMLNILSVILNQFITLMFFYIIVTKLPNLKGWSLNSLILVYGLYLFNKGGADLFSAGAYNLETLIQEGTLDSFITKPIPVLLQVFVSQFDFFQLVNIFVGIVLLGFLFYKDVISLNIFSIVCIAFFQIDSVILVFFLKVLTMSIAFWTQTGYPVTSSVDNLSEFAKYPLSIYKRFVSFVLTFIFPYAFLSFFPALILLSISNIYMCVLITIVVTLIIIIISLLIWTKGLKRYESSGH